MLNTWARRPPLGAWAGESIMIGDRLRIRLLWVWIAGVILLAPILTRPTIAIELAAALIGGALAWRSVAYPLAVAGVPPLIDAIVGYDPLPKGGFTFIFTAWIGLAMLFALARGRAKDVPRALMCAPVMLSFALLGLMLARLGASLDQAYGSTKAQLYVADVLIFVVGGVFVGIGRRDLRLFLGLTLTIQAVGAFIFLLELVSGGTHTILEGRYSLAAQEYPIYLGRDSAEGLLIAIYTIMAARTRTMRLAAVAAAPALIVALVAAGSRGPTVAFVLGLFAMLLAVAANRRTRRRLMPVLAALLVAIIAVPLVVPSSSISRALSTLIGSSSGLSSNGRSVVWAQAIRAFEGHPLLGIGWGGFAALNPELSFTHNLIIEVATELGVFGAIMVIWILVSSVRKFLFVWRSTSGVEKLQASLLIALFVDALVNAMVSGAIEDNGSVWLWAGLGVGMAAGVRIRRRARVRRRAASLAAPPAPEGLPA